MFIEPGTSNPAADTTGQASVSSAVRGLVDRFGRTATDLRISLTDRCNLRCVYCMPAEGLTWLPQPSTLTDDEIVRLARIGTELLGIRSIRLTGGEPLLRPGLANIVAALAALQPRPDISLTTNAVGLARTAGQLADAGLDRINVSLDTLQRSRYTQLTRRDRFDDVMQGLDAIRATGMTPIKLNTVLMRGINDDEASDLLSFALAHGYQLRIIEQMPLDPMHQWSRDTMITADEVLSSLAQHWTLTPDPAHRGAAPAETWLVNGGPATVGVIASVTRPFCGTCDRARLTADGQIRTCLFARKESDLRSPMRAGASDAELARLWQIAAMGKAAGHGVDHPDFLPPQRPMSAIGG